LSDVVDQIKLPYTTVEGVWKKAASLVAEANAIVPAPGFDAKDNMVKSKPGAAPHLVGVSTKYKYKCDHCPHFKSINLCSHIVAVAESNGNLVEFVKQFHTKPESDPNLMQIVPHDIPAGAGRKNGKAHKKPKKSKQSPSNDNRVPLLNTSSVTNCVSTTCCKSVNNCHTTISVSINASYTSSMDDSFTSTIFTKPSDKFVTSI